MKRRLTALVAVLLVVVAAGILVRPAAEKLSRPVNPKLVSADNEFAFDLFREVVKGEKGRSVLISPVSAALALQMTYGGAGGKIQEAMAKALALQGMTPEEVYSANAGLIASLQNSDRKVQLEIANSLWATKPVEFKPEFEQRTRESFRADVFRSGGNPSRQINAWVKEKTHDKIKGMGGDMGGGWVLLLMNAVYFKGQWTKQFDPERTEEMDFYVAENKYKTVPFMNNPTEFDYLAARDFQAVRLPYGKGRLAMYVFLPAWDADLDTFLRTLNAENWKKWMSQFRKRDVQLALPKFRMDYEVNLNQALKDLGMGGAFDPDKADFSAMSPTHVWVQKVLQKAFVDVNEEGTEAAAVTAVSMTLGGGGPPRMWVDRPFFYAIQDDRTGLILFMGTMTDPAPRGEAATR